MVANSQAIDTFVENVKSIHDTDYGDFMRKSNLYFNRMLESFPNSEGEKKKILLNIKTQIQFSQDRDIDMALLKILKESEKLKKLV